MKLPVCLFQCLEVWFNSIKIAFDIYSFQISYFEFQCFGRVHCLLRCLFVCLLVQLLASCFSFFKAAIWLLLKNVFDWSGCCLAWFSFVSSFFFSGLVLVLRNFDAFSRKSEVLYFSRKAKFFFPSFFEVPAREKEKKTYSWHFHFQNVAVVRQEGHSCVFLGANSIKI